MMDLTTIDENKRISNPRKDPPFPYTASLWMLSTVIVIFCSSGGVLTLLTGPPLFQHAEGGGMILLGGDKYQYMGETFIVLLLNGGMMLCVIVLALSDSAWVVIGSLATLIIFLRLYVMLYIGKQLWYAYHIKNTGGLWLSFLYVPTP